MLGIAQAKAIQGGGKAHGRFALANPDDNDDTLYSNNESGSKENCKSASADADNINSAVYGNKAVHDNNAVCNVLRAVLFYSNMCMKARYKDQVRARYIDTNVCAKW
jgi:hypothetical protein